MVHNNVDYYIPILGTWLLGGVVSVVNPNSSVKALADQLMRTESSFVFCYPKIASHVLDAIKMNKVRTRQLTPGL